MKLPKYLPGTKVYVEDEDNKSVVFSTVIKVEHSFFFKYWLDGVIGFYYEEDVKSVQDYLNNMDPFGNL